MADSTITAGLQVEGVAEVLKALSKVDPELRKATVKRMKQAGEPMAREARSLFPQASPLSNWGNWRGGYDGKAVHRGVRVAYRGSKVRGSDSNTIPLLTLRQTNAAGAIYDMAGRTSNGNSPQGRAFIAQLRQDGVASRAMWPAAERTMPDVTAAVEDAINDMSAAIEEMMR